MTKRILIAIDATPASTGALNRAIEIAGQADTELRLVHVVDETRVPWEDRGALPRQRAIDAATLAGRRALTESTAMIRAAGHRASSVLLRRLRVGDTIGSMIADEAGASGADMILVGSRRRGMLHRALRGGVEGQLSRKVEVPVIPVQGPRSRGRRSTSACTPGHLCLS